MLETINIKNILSFDNAGVEAKLHRINLLIGKNLTGKTNFVSAIKMSCTQNGRNYEINGKEIYNSLAITNDWFSSYTNMLNISKDNNVKNMFQYEMQKFNTEFLDFNFTSVSGSINIIEKSRDTYLSELPRSYQNYFAIIAELLNPFNTVAFIELGNFMHKDYLIDILDLLNRVSLENGKQVFIKTYSRDVLDYYSDNPEYLILFEKEDGITKIKQFINNELNEYLKNYSLGTIWSMGIIGGNVY